MFVFAHLFPDISIKSSKFHFWSLKTLFSYDFALFLVNDCQGIEKLQCKTALGLNIPLIYLRHMKVSWIKAYQISCLFILISMYPRPEEQIWLEMYQVKRFIDMKQSPLFMFYFYQVGFCSVSFIADEYSIYHFRIMIKDLSISFSRVIIVQDFKTVTFNVTFNF